MGLFVPPNPTTSIFTRMQKYWTKKSFFPASKATSHIFSYHSWFGFIASMNVSRLDELPFLLVGYIARPTFHATLLLAVYLCHKEKIQLSWLDFFPLLSLTITRQLWDGLDCMDGLDGLDFSYPSILSIPSLFMLSEAFSWARYRHWFSLIWLTLSLSLLCFIQSWVSWFSLQESSCSGAMRFLILQEQASLQRLRYGLFFRR